MGHLRLFNVDERATVSESYFHARTVRATKSLHKDHLFENLQQRSTERILTRKWLKIRRLENVADWPRSKGCRIFYSIFSVVFGSAVWNSYRQTSIVLDVLNVERHVYRGCRSFYFKRRNEQSIGRDPFSNLKISDRRQERLRSFMSENFHSLFWELNVASFLHVSIDRLAWIILCVPTRIRTFSWQSRNIFIFS